MPNCLLQTKTIICVTGPVVESESILVWKYYIQTPLKSQNVPTHGDALVNLIPDFVLYKGNFDCVIFSFSFSLRMDLNVRIISINISFLKYNKSKVFTSFIGFIRESFVGHCGSVCAPYT